MPAKKTKKTNSKTTKKTTSQTIVSKSTKASENFSHVVTQPRKGLNRKLLIAALIILSLALLGYKFMPWLVPAMVDKKPITRLDVYRQMNKAYGQQTLNDLVNEAVIKEAVKKANVKVDPAKVQQQIDQFKKQFEKLGGLDQVLAQRGLTLDDLKDQIKTQLAIEEILKDKITPSDKEVKAEYDKNKDTLYKGKKFDEVKDQITNSLKQVKLSKAFMDWFQKVKKEIQVKYLAPTPTPAPSLQQ